MEFIKAHPKQSLLAGSLAAALIAFTVTACGGGSAATSATSATSAQGSPGHWTAAQVSQFTSAAGSDGSASQDSCIAGYFERDTSFGNAMDVVSVAPASGPSMSAAQIKAALISKYGTAMGDAINAQLTQVVNDSNNNCGGTAASSTAPAAAPTDTADPAGTAARQTQRTRPRRRSHRAPSTALTRSPAGRAGGWRRSRGRSRMSSRTSTRSPRIPAMTRRTSAWTAASWKGTRRPPWTPITTRPRPTTPTGPPR